MRHEAIFTKFSQPVQRWWAGLKQWRLGGGEGRGEKGGRGESKGEKMLRVKEKERDGYECKGGGGEREGERSEGRVLQFNLCKNGPRGKCLDATLNVL